MKIVYVFLALFCLMQANEFELPMMRSPEANTIWHNGLFVPWNQATTHLLSYSLHYGVGAFEGIRVYQTEKGPAIFRLYDHIARLFYSFDYFAQSIDYSTEDIAHAICDTITYNNIRDGYIRPLMYLGYGKMGLYYKNSPVEIMIASWPVNPVPENTSIYAKISPYIRIHPKSTFVDKKICGHYVNSVLALIDAREDSYNDAILLDHEGYVAEGLAANIFMVKNGILYTPQVGTILPGITRDTIIHIAEYLSIPCIEKQIHPDELLDADEAFFTSTALGIRPIHKINEMRFSYTDTGTITQTLRQAYESLVHGEWILDDTWLTYIDQE